MDIKTTLGLLNRFHRSDPEACEALTDHRVEANEALLDDPDIIVLADEGQPPVVGMTGIINGILHAHGIESRIAASYDDGPEQKFLGFVIMD